MARQKSPAPADPTFRAGIVGFCAGWIVGGFYDLTRSED